MLATVLIALLGAGGCAAFRVPEPPPISTLARPQWNSALVLEHVRFLNRDDLQGRATGTVGGAEAAGYLSARMYEARLQPAAGDDYRVLYRTPLNDIRGAAIIVLDRDSVFLSPGREFVADGRSDSGSVLLEGLIRYGGRSLPQATPGTALVVPDSNATMDLLDQAVRMGYRAVLIEGFPTGQLAAGPVHGLLIVRVTSQGLSRLTGPPQPRRIFLRVVRGPQTSAGALNVMGYVAGKSPVYAREAIIVCANLDGPGRFMDVTLADPVRQAAGSAALLELARQYSQFSRFMNLPDRTILFSVFSGSLLGHAGLRDYLKRPLWPIDRTRAVIFLGLNPSDEPDVRRLVESNGIRFISVPQQVPENVNTRVVPDDLVDHSASQLAAQQEALRLLEAVHPILKAEAVTPEPPVTGYPMNRPETPPEPDNR